MYHLAVENIVDNYQFDHIDLEELKKKKMRILNHIGEFSFYILH